MRAFEQRKKNTSNNSSFFGPKIQKKLKTGTPGDQFEVEADKVADKVVSNNSSSGLLQSKSEEEVQQKPISETISSVQSKEMKEEEPVQKKSEEKEEKVQKKEEEKEPVQKKEKEEEKPVQKKEEKEEPIQAKCAECEKEEKVQKKENEEEKSVQKKEQNSGKEGQENELEGKLNNSKGGGIGLDKKTKGEMESGFGNDFSDVKIHTDTNAVQMSQELGAQAFTNGNDVYFNKGKYNPNSKESKHLLAHELTHTIQQTGMVQKSVMENHPEDLQSERPENPQYKNNPPLEKANDNEMLIATGHKGGYVEEIQSGLLQLGHKLPNYGADGDFGSETRNAVIDFQTKNYLDDIDGIVGPETMGALDNKVVKQKGGKKDGCEGEVPFKKGPFFSEESAGFFSTPECPKVTITIDITAHIVDFHHCSTMEISIDHVGRTKKTIPIDNDGKGHFKDTFKLKNHKDIHKLFFTMPEACKGMGDSFSVEGKIKRHS